MAKAFRAEYVIGRFEGQLQAQQRGALRALHHVCVKWPVSDPVSGLGIDRQRRGDRRTVDLDRNRRC